MVPYPAFDDSGGAHAADLALLRLVQKVAPTPVPLVPASRAGSLHVGNQAFIAGWGNAKPPSVGKGKPVARLRNALVRLRPSSFCSREWAKEPFDSTSELCSTASSGEACYGDSGGPLFVDRGYPRSELFGVILDGAPHCRPGHVNLYANLVDGPLRRWLELQLAGAEKRLVSCPDVTVRGLLGTVVVREVLTNTGCATASATARDVSARDECVEETPSGVNDCESNEFRCETRLEMGPAGVAFRTSCRQGTLKISFRQGAATFAEGPRYRLAFASDGRPVRVGPFDIAAGHRTIRDAIAAFGRPDALIFGDTGCELRWAQLGLEADTVNYSSRDDCGLDSGYVNDFVIVSPRFETDRGLVVGMSEEELRARHPEATTRGPISDSYFDDESPLDRGARRLGSIYSIHVVASPIGVDGRYGSLKGLVEHDELTALQVVPLLGGD